MRAGTPHLLTHCDQWCIRVLSVTSRVLAEELLRLTTLLQRAATPDDVVAAVRGDFEHKLRPAFRNLTSAQAGPARLA